MGLLLTETSGATCINKPDTRVITDDNPREVREGRGSLAKLGRGNGQSGGEGIARHAPEHSRDQTGVCSNFHKLLKLV